MRLLRGDGDESKEYQYASFHDLNFTSVTPFKTVANKKINSAELLYSLLTQFNFLSNLMFYNTLLCENNINYYMLFDNIKIRNSYTKNMLNLLIFIVNINL